MGLVGADLEQMHTLARTLDQAADRLEAASGTVTGLLGSVPWSGPDSERYRSQWHGESRAMMRSVAAALREAAHTVTRNATEQEQASAVGSSGSGSGIGGAISSAFGSPFSGILPSGIDAAPFNPLTAINDFRDSNLLWPITWGTALGKFDKGAGSLLDALGLLTDSTMTPEDKLVGAGNQFTDLAGGLLKGSNYWGGVAVQQWGDVVANAAKADFSPSGVQTVTDYIAQDPGGAFNAAKDAVIAYMPKLAANLLPW